MQTLFEEYFYHDVLIKEISIKNNEKGHKLLKFVLVNEDGQIWECAFNEASQLFILTDFRICGNVFIAQAVVDENDEILFEYKKKWSSFVSQEVLNKIRCFTIQTTHGETIKILSKDDIVVSEQINH